MPTQNPEIAQAGAKGLRAQLLRLAVRSEDGRLFYTGSEVEKLLTKETVRSVVKPLFQDNARHHETFILVNQGGHKLLAILLLIDRVDLLDYFIDTHTTLPNCALDSRLPFVQEDLLDLFKSVEDSDTLASVFFEKQWEVLAPVFQPNLGHRTFADMQVLPFLFNSTMPIGEGAFGLVEKVEMLSSHCALATASSSKTIVVVRKLIKPTESDSDEDSPSQHESAVGGAQGFRNEARILTLLRVLKHPCLLKLLGSYTFRQKHYLLFPLAESDLAGALVSGKLLEFDFEVLLHHLIGLVSAVKHLHVYFSEEFELEMIGCHRDLKPRNILVLGDKLVLSDFGLSSLKQNGNSKSMFRTGDRSYMAPECETFENSDTFTVKKHIVGRATDIWALGGILTEIICCIVKGTAGIKAYKQARKITMGGSLTVCQFHHGGKRSLPVEEWIASMMSIASSDQKRLLKLASACLEIDPAKRPLAHELLCRMHLISHLQGSRVAVERFEELESLEPSLELSIERERLRLWEEALASEEKRRDLTWFQELQEFSLRRIHELIKLIDVELVTIREAAENPTLVPVITRLRELISQIWNFLPHQISDDSNQLLISRIYHEADIWLDGVQRDLHLHYNYSDLASFVAMKQISTLLRNTGSKVYTAYLENKVVTNQTDIGFHKSGMMHERATVEDRGCEVLLEQVEYNASWADQSHREELLERVNSIAVLLQRPFLVPEVRLLKCLGLMHNLEHHSIALIFELRSGTPKTFRQVLNATQSDRRSRPLLGSVFRFAHDIARSLLQYHLLGWFHKNIAADNILFFVEDSTPRALLTGFEKPYLIGFNHARQSNDEALSHGAANLPSLRHYIHPEYLSGKHNARYKWHYDTYSLGIVLLEAGLWRCVSDWTSSEKWRKLKLSPFDMRRKIADELVPILGSSMGRTYMGVVTACLAGKFESPGQSSEETMLSFKAQVINPLTTLLRV